MGKKGISPLIATVLIIGFTVALAAIIITWGGRFIQQTQEDVDVSTQIGLACSRLSFEIAKIECTIGACRAGTCAADGDCGTAGGDCNGVCDDNPAVVCDVGDVSGCDVPASATCINLDCAAGDCTEHVDCGTAGGDCSNPDLDVITINSNSDEKIAGFTFRATDENSNVFVDVDSATGSLAGFATNPYTWDDDGDTDAVVNAARLEAIAHVEISGENRVCQAGIEKVERSPSVCGFTN